MHVVPRLPSIALAALLALSVAPAAAAVPPKATDGGQAPATAAKSEAAPSKGPTMLRGGRNRACLLRDNHVRCWGENQQGILGDGTQLTRDFAVPVQGLPKGQIVDLIVNDAVACVRYAAAPPWCWGAYNRPDHRKYLPTKLVGFGDDVTAVALGRSHQCGLSSKGVVRCVGRNPGAALGHPSQRFEGIATPSLPEPATNVLGLSDAVCATLKSGKTVCWGRHHLGLFGQPNTPCFGTPFKGSGGCSHKPQVATLPAVPTFISQKDRDLCALDGAGDVTCLLRGALHKVASSAAEVAVGHKICIREVGGQVRCSGKRAEVCEMSGKRRRCRATLNRAGEARWAEALVELPDASDALSIGLWGERLCVAHADRRVTCHGLRRNWGSKERVAFPDRAVIQKERVARTDELQRLKSNAANDLFSGARWFAQHNSDSQVRMVESVKVALAMVLAGRTAEGHRLAKGSRLLVTTFADMASSGDCSAALALAEVPGNWKWSNFDAFNRICARAVTPAMAVRVGVLFRKGAEAAANHRRRQDVHMLAATFYGHRGEVSAALNHAREAGSASRREVRRAIELGYGSAFPGQLNKYTAGLGGALERIAEAPTEEFAEASDGLPARPIERTLERLIAVLPGVGPQGLDPKTLANWRKWGLTAIARHRMSPLRRADLTLQVLVASKTSHMSSGVARKWLSRAKKWSRAALKEPASRSKRPSKQVAKNLVAAQVRFGKGTGLKLVAQLVKWGLLDTRGVAGQLAEEGDFAGAMAMAASEPNRHMRLPTYSKILRATLLSNDCKASAKALQKVPVHTLSRARVVTLSEVCPKELAAAVSTMERAGNERFPGMAVALASQGQWRAALQASAHLHVRNRAETWAYVALFWERAGRPKLDELKPVITAILE